MCPVNIVRNVEFINYQAISKCLCEQGPTCIWGGSRNLEIIKPIKNFYGYVYVYQLKRMSLTISLIVEVYKLKLIDLEVSRAIHL